MMEGMETSLTLKYSGPAVDDGRMDVYAASANMIAFSEFMVVATKATFGEQATAHAEVTGFAKGSFATNLLFSIGGQAATILTTVPADQLMTVIKGAFSLWKHLKGSPPKGVQHAEQTVTVTNNAGQVIQVQTQSLTLVLNEKASEAADKFIRQAMAVEGMQTISLDSPTESIAQATREESQYFLPVAASETVADNVTRMGFTIESPSFKDGNKWKLSDGSQSFFVEMQDQDFLDRINGGERFGKGDMLIVDVRLLQKRSGAKFEIERSILKVIEHRQGSAQFPLL